MKKNWLRSIFLCYLMICGIGCVPHHEVIPVSAEQEKSAKLLIAKGILSLQRKDLYNAETYFSLSRDIIDSAEALDGLGCVSFAYRDFERAKDLFSEARTLNPKYARVLGNAALVYEKNGDYEVAKRLYERALIETPEDSEVRNNYGAFLVEYEGKKRSGEFEIVKASHLKQHEIIEKNLRILEREF